MFSATVEADSVSPDGVRLTTLVIHAPRFILPSLLTHRALSRNAASSRAIPVAKMIAAVEADPFIPQDVYKNCPGMQGRDPLSRQEWAEFEFTWRDMRNHAVNAAWNLAQRGIHKQTVNRLLEPFAWTTVVVTATDWKNFFALRCHPDAQPEMQKVATLMRDAMAGSEPEKIGASGWSIYMWHLPFMRDEDRAAWAASKLSAADLRLMSAGRCARVSYLGHDGKRDPYADIALAQRLIKDRHMSPFEHVATPAPGRWANFRGWRQMRLDLPGNVVEG
jgi:hypothetical protein